MIKKENIKYALLDNSKCRVLKDNEIFSVIFETLKQSNVLFSDDIEVSVSVVFVTDNEIQLLNKNYRNKDMPTDVLSFADDFVDKDAPGVDSKNEGIIVQKNISLGDIILSCATIKRYATMDSVDIINANRFVLSHGILHTLGYNHSEMMFDIQDSVVEKLS